MPHATMTLIPGIDTNETPTLNQAAFSQSQLVRFMTDRNGKGLAQKIGGWEAWSNSTFLNTNELRAWEDLNGTARLAIGTNTAIYYAAQTSPDNPIAVTPQTIAGNARVGSAQTATITIASPAVITPATSVPINTTPVTFTTTGALPTGLTVGKVYYVVNAGATTFQVSATIGGTAVNTSGTQSGVHTVTIPIASTDTTTNSNGTTTVTIYDTGTGVQSVTFANNIITVGTDASGANGVTPVTGDQVVFLGASLPSGVTANTTYYVINPTGITYQIATTSTSTSPVTFSTGSGTQYSSNSLQMQMQTGYNVYIQTPISISNLLLSGVYAIATPITGSYYNIYTIVVPQLVNATTAIGTLPSFQLTQNVNTVTVTEPNHPYVTGQTAAFLYPTTSNNITIYGNYIVTLDPTTPATKYIITASSVGGSTVSVDMNSGYAHFIYYFNIPSLSSSSGYGTGQYGYGGYGTGVPLSVNQTNTITTTDWTINNFGEILIANPQDGPIYYWSPSTNSSTSYLLPTAPMTNRGFFIAMPARQIVTYGSTATGIQDPLLVKWSDAADATVWIAAANNQAGSYRIPEGSLIVGAIQAPQQALIFTDLAVWAMQYVGLPNVYGFNKLADGTGLIAKKAVANMNGITYWMSPQKFMRLANSGPEPIPCSVWDKVYQNINTGNLSNGQPAYSLIRCATNSVFGEVTWYYPSTTATYNDRYVKFNIYTQQWDYGTLDRTAWIDQSVLGTPIGASSSGVIYQHEMGYNAGTSGMVSSFQTGYIQLNEADNLIFIDQIWPDFKFTTEGGGTGGTTTPSTVYVTFYGTDYPGDTPIKYGPYTVTSSTEYISTRIRNRLLSIAVSTSPDGTTADTNTFYRIGAVRYRYQTDGKF